MYFGSFGERNDRFYPALTFEERKGERDKHQDGSRVNASRHLEYQNFSL
jgi:hypothetical protein